MSQEDFTKQLAIATSLVDKWPAWKQNILEIYASPTVAVARTPVDNGSVRKENYESPKDDRQS